MIFGRVIRETPKAFEFEIAGQLGDAPHFGLCGRVWFRKDECRVIRWAHRGLDSLECSTTLLRKKAAAPDMATCE
jgi:hypothetical protein